MSLRTKKHRHILADNILNTNSKSKRVITPSILAQNISMSTSLTLCMLFVTHIRLIDNERLTTINHPVMLRLKLTYFKV